MEAPIILCLLDSGELKLFRDLTSLESDIEGIDVLNGEYMAFDSVGTMIDLAVDNQWGMPGASMSAVLSEGLLREWILKNYRINPAVARCNSLVEMVNVLKRLYGYEDSK